MSGMAYEDKDRVDDDGIHIVYRNGKRFYRAEGHDYISVTTMLKLIKDDDWVKYATYQFESKNPLAQGPNGISFEEYADDAKLLGKYFHWRVGAELARKAGLPKPFFDPERPLPDYREEDFEMCMMHWDDMRRVFNPMVYNAGLEKFLASPLGYGGRVDLVCEPDYDSWIDAMPLWRKNFTLVDGIKRGERWLLDWKTGKRIYQGTEAQLTAYFMAWNHLYPDYPVQRMAIVHVQPKRWRFVETKGDVASVAKAINIATQRGLIRPNRELLKSLES
jgi:hypothetical protein